MTNIVTFSEYPLIQDKLAEIRERNTPSNRFTQLMHEITLLMLNKVTFFLPTLEYHICTPVATAKVSSTNYKCPPIIIPILRAGLGMSKAFTTMLPIYKYGEIGLRRNEETKLPEKYIDKLPNIPKGSQVFVLDPMLATGGSARLTALWIKKKCDHDDYYLNFVGMVASPQGIERLKESRLYNSIYVAAIDRELNADAYIVPGLGDAGDRLFGVQK